MAFSQHFSGIASWSGTSEGGLSISPASSALPAALFQPSFTSAVSLLLLSSVKVRECTWRPEEMKSPDRRRWAAMSRISQKRLIWITKPEECGTVLQVLGTRQIFSQTCSFFFFFFSPVWSDNCSFLWGPNNTTAPLCNESFPLA